MRRMVLDAIVLALVMLAVEADPVYWRSIPANETTPFMKKHNLRPGHGWGKKAGLQTLGPGPVGVNEKLSGLFIRPCLRLGSMYGQPVSAFDTRHYADDSTYEIDRTFYIGDANCVPALSDVYYKTTFQGVITYHGPSQLQPEASLAELEWTDSKEYFMSSTDGEQLVKQLRQECPCNADWKTDVTIKVDPSQCDPIDPNANVLTLCKMISGLADYFSYKWTDSWHYVTSKDDFNKTTGWSNTINESYLREKIPEYGNTDPADCGYALWKNCTASGLDAAATNCDTCTGLECDGCLFRELNPDWNAKIREDNNNNWYRCCPCIHKYAKMFSKPWMHTMC
jgi:hypothetical protein